MKKTKKISYKTIQANTTLLEFAKEKKLKEFIKKEKGETNEKS